MNTNQKISPTPFVEAMQRIEGEYELLEAKTRKLLVDRGWIYTSNTPGSLWMWEKKLPDGRTLLVDAGSAIELERQADFDGLTAEQVDALERESS